jgi:hypothetical protein
MFVFLIIYYVFSSTKSENKREEQIQPGSRGWWEGVMWPKQCIHIWVNVKMIK